MPDKNVVDRPERDISMYPKPDMEEWKNIWEFANIQKDDDERKRPDVDVTKAILHDTMPLRTPIVDRNGIEYMAIKFDQPRNRDMKKFLTASNKEKNDAIGSMLGFEVLVGACSVEPKLNTYMYEQITPADLAAINERFLRNMWLGATNV